MEIVLFTFETVRIGTALSEGGRGEGGREMKGEGRKGKEGEERGGEERERRIMEGGEREKGGYKL